MRVDHFHNRVEVRDIDLFDDMACLELGRIVAEECVVRVHGSVPETRLHDIQMLWGDPTSGIIDGYLATGKLSGAHWRPMKVTMAQARQDFDRSKPYYGLARVSYEKDKRGRARGFFSNGELNWHSDRQSIDDAQVVVGLMSLWGTEGSQTSFLRTANAYEALSAEDKSMVDELITVWAWDGGSMSKGLIDNQMTLVNYIMVPVDGIESPLVSHTAAGRKGIRFPSHSFSHFRGMSREESLKFKEHLWKQLHRDEHIYLHDWQDGEIVFMDQNITLHARPTNVTDGDKRTLARMITHVNHLYPDGSPFPHVRYKGEYVDHDSFAGIVDAKRRKEFYAD